MRKYGTVETARLMRIGDLPSAGPVKSYRLEEELETRIAKNLQAMIRIGQTVTKDDRDRREDSIRQIIIECYKALDKERGV